MSKDDSQPASLSSHGAASNPRTDFSLASPFESRNRWRMDIAVNYYSYFRDLTGCAQTTETLPAGSSIADLMNQLIARFPNLRAMQNSTLIAVGVDYQGRGYLLREGDEVSLFPPVQGG